MSKYTTGELAKRCGVSVRTVQYYDARNILAPSELSEGGRRLYSEEDLQKMQLICFLREMGFSIDNIGALLSEAHSEEVIALLIERREKQLTEELQERQRQMDLLTELRRALRTVDAYSVQSLGDIAQMLKDRKKRRRMLAVMLAVGVLMDLLEVSMVVYGAKTGNWWPLLLGIPLLVAMGVGISGYYLRHSAYICPACHAVFVPSFWTNFWARHTPNTRRLTCPHCGETHFCVEIYKPKEEDDVTN